MLEPPCRALRILLRVFHYWLLREGVLMIFAERPLIVRLAIPALLYWLRPRHVHWEPVGNF